MDMVFKLLQWKRNCGGLEASETSVLGSGRGGRARPSPGRQPVWTENQGWWEHPLLMICGEAKQLAAYHPRESTVPLASDSPTPKTLVDCLANYVPSQTVSRPVRRVSETITNDEQAQMEFIRRNLASTSGCGPKGRYVQTICRGRGRAWNFSGWGQPDALPQILAGSQHQQLVWAVDKVQSNSARYMVLTPIHQSIPPPSPNFTNHHFSNNHPSLNPDSYQLDNRDSRGGRTPFRIRVMSSTTLHP
ncbi:uncharacterized protein CLUP02_07840 [Colletotrichum lupini]|uniref:Uncharacterized protein n=1 Tax=Colletotrichum lupini TaxID=145971 RepID=A0A9Q8STL5_9PEZI|nr:uncharacterized protein CLUP02_07840 [Colletotrichum lupini]UQC82352.1 hypothetical protein CLUP02_07840 [Colletotrichum lupini]